MRVLVSAASRHGSTEEIAGAIARQLLARGIEVVRGDLDQVAEGGQYDAVVLGSAVYGGHWLEDATAAVGRHARELRQRPVWLFSSGPVGGIPARAPDVDAVVDLVRPRDHRVLGGRLDRRCLGLLERAMVRVARAHDGDDRDWAAIDTWADGIADALVGPGEARHDRMTPTL